MHGGLVTMLREKLPFLLVLILLGLPLTVATESDNTPETERVLRGGTTKNERDLQCTEPRKLMQSGHVLQVGETWNSWDEGKYASIKLEANANLVIRRSSDGQVLCESGVNEPSDNVPYVSKLYGDGNLITWRSPEQVPPRVWKSNAVGPTTSTYYLAVSCDDSVSIYQDSVYGPVLWTCPGSGKNSPPSPTPQPAPQPTPQQVTTPQPDPVTTFCVFADTPYHYHENEKLLNHVESMDSECEFVVHLGDIRSARLFDTCVQETYTNASKIMRRSSKPVVMILGDNEWNDCPNHEQALEFWHDEFDGFHDEHWQHNFNIASQPGRVENLFFVYRKTLFIALNMVGGRIVDQTEWDNRLASNFQWSRALIEEHVRGPQADANVVVLMAHATNSPNHRGFFHSMRDYIDYDLKNAVPILYLNGDVHSWNEQPQFFEQWNWKRITLVGNSRDKPLKVTVDASDGVNSVDDAFYFRRFY